MKQTSVILSCAIAFAVAAFTLAAIAAEPAKATAPAKAKALTPSELKRIRNENYGKSGQALWKIRNACQEYNRKQVPFEPLTEAYLAFTMIPIEKGGLQSLTPSVAHRRIARTLMTPINLRLLPLIEKHFAEAERLAKTPEEKADVRYEKARFSLIYAREDDLGKFRKIMLETLADQAIPPMRRLELLRSDAEDDILTGIDYEKIGWDIVSDTPKAHDSYYRAMLRIIHVHRWQAYNRLDPRYSKERTIAICDKALADPAVSYKTYYLEKKADALVEMRRNDEAEQLLLAAAATTNPPVCHENNMILGDFYFKTSERYYADPNPILLKKALTAYVTASQANPRSVKPLPLIAKTAARLNDHDLVIETYRSMIALQGGKTNQWAAIALGDAYFAKDDLSTAIECYSPYAERLRNESMMNFCRALFIEKRYEECAKWLKHHAKFARKRDAKDEARYFLECVEKAMADKKE